MNTLLLIGLGAALLCVKPIRKAIGIGSLKRTHRVGAVEMTHPAVYVGTYKKYNSGSLFGEWVDLTKFDTYEDFMRYIRKLHKDESDPEFMIQDFEGFPEALYRESGISKDTFNKIKEYYEAFDGDDVKKQAFEAYTDWAGSDASVEKFENAYFGTFDSEYDYIDEMIEGGVIDPASWAKREGTWVYDHDAIWRYLDTGGDVMSAGTDYGVAIWNPR